MLITAYGEFIKNFVINSLVTVPNPNKGQRCLNGKTYKIFEDKNSIIIIKKIMGKKFFDYVRMKLQGILELKIFKDLR
jgi:hypothetical protein